MEVRDVSKPGEIFWADKIMHQKLAAILVSLFHIDGAVLVYVQYHTLVNALY